MPRPARSDMRERILDVALELFNEQGYERSSLRQIAERLDVSKAALYYHFERKEDILLALHMRLHELGHDLLGEIDRLDARDLADAWPSLLDRLIDKVVENRDVFLLHQRNEHAFRALAENDEHRAENEDIQQRFSGLFSDAAIPLEQRVRMAASVAAVFAVLIGAGPLFGDAPADELAAQLRALVRDISTPAVR